MIRQAIHGDELEIAVLMGEFHSKSGLPGKYSFEHVQRLAEGLIANPNACILLSPEGLIAGTLMPAIFDPGWITSVEFAWYAPDGHGIKLLTRYMDWSRQAGAQEVRMSSINELGDRVHRILQRRYGARVVEQSYSLLL